MKALIAKAPPPARARDARKFRSRSAGRIKRVVLQSRHGLCGREPELRPMPLTSLPRRATPCTRTVPRHPMARICLINPRFPTSFWGLNHGLPLLGKKANMPVLALPVLAGLTPPEHEVVLIDENVQELDFDALEAFDI